MNHITENHKKYLESQLRRIFAWSKAYKDCQKRAEVLEGKLYRCESCNELIDKRRKYGKEEYKGEPVYNRKLHVDHVVPYTPLEGWKDMQDWAENCIRRCWTTLDNLQYVCYPCHKKKTVEENEIRKIHRARKKANNI